MSDLLLTTAAVIIIYADNRFATLTPLAYTQLLLTLDEEARKKVLQKTHRLREDLVTVHRFPVPNQGKDKEKDKEQGKD